MLPDWDVPHGKNISAISAHSSVNFQGWLIIPDHAELFPKYLILHPLPAQTISAFRPCRGRGYENLLLAAATQQFREFMYSRKPTRPMYAVFCMSIRPVLQAVTRLRTESDNLRSSEAQTQRARVSGGYRIAAYVFGRPSVYARR